MRYMVAALLAVFGVGNRVIPTAGGSVPANALISNAGSDTLVSNSGSDVLTGNV